MKIKLGSGNVAVMTIQDQESKIDYGLAMKTHQERHEIGEEDFSVVGHMLSDVGADLVIEFTRWESVQVVIDKLIIVRDSLKSAQPKASSPASLPFDKIHHITWSWGRLLFPWFGGWIAFTRAYGFRFVKRSDFHNCRTTKIS